MKFFTSLNSDSKRYIVKAFQLTIGFILFLTFAGIAQTRTASVSGNWNNTATWGGQSVPTAVMDVVINSGISVTMNVTGSCATVSTSTGTATLAGGSALTISGNVTIVAGTTLAITASSITCQGSLTTSGSGTANLTGTISNSAVAANTLFLSAASPTVAGSNTIAVSGNILLASAKTLTVNTTVTSATLSTGTLNSTTATIAGTGSVSVAGAITINGSNNNPATLAISSGTTVTCTSVAQGSGNSNTTYTLSVTGVFKFSGANLTALGALTCNAGSTVEYNGTTQSVFATTYVNLTLSGSGTKTAAGAITISGALNIPSGVTFDMVTNALSGATLTTTGTGTLLTQKATVAVPSGISWSMVVGYNGGSQAVIAGAYTNLSFTTSGTKTLAAAVTISGNLSIASSVVASLNAGTTYTVGTLTLNNFGKNSGTWGGTGSGATNINTTFFAATTGIVSVTTDTRPTLTITANSASKVYGILITSPVTGSTAFSSTGLVNGETIGSVTLNYGAGALVATASVGSTSTITPSAATGGTFTSANYIISYTANSGTLTVTPAPLTVTATAQSKPYDGAVFSPFTTTITGFVNGETVSVVSGAATYSGTATTAVNAGSYTITPALGTLTATNYSFTTFANGTLTISKVALTVTADAKSKSYDGSVFSPFTSTITGFVNGESAGGVVTSGAATYSGTAIAAVNAGSYTITPALGTLTATNYSFTTFANGTLTISKVALTVTADAKSKSYNGSVFSPFTSTITGFVNGETVSKVSGAATYSGTAIAAVNAGSYTITPALGTLTATNYSFTIFANGTLTISQVGLTVTAAAKSKPYDGSVFSPFTSTITGFVNGETVAVVSGAAAYTGTATTAVNAGSYTITPTLGTLTATNYSFTTFTNGTLTISKVGLTVTADAKSKSYNGAVFSPFTATITGFVNGETIAVVSGAATYSGTAVAAVNAGSYTITPAIGTLTATNYSFTTFANGTLTISKVGLTVTADAKSKSYDGSVFSPFTSTITGFVNGETVSKVSGAATYSGTAVAAVNAGSYTITPAIGTLTATNYSFTTFVNGTLTINKATPILTVTNSPVTFDGATHSATVNVTAGAGAVSNILTGGAATQTNVGTYAVTADVAASANYTALTSGSAGNFIINKTTPTLSVTNTPQIYTGSPIAAIVSGTGGGTVSNIQYNGSSTIPTNAGTYAITADIGASTNYNAATGASAGNFIINQATPILTITNTPQTYTGSPIAAIVSGTGGGAVSNIQYNSSGTTPTNSGTYAITADIAASANYTALTGASAGSFVISKVTPTVSVTNSPQVYTGSPIAANVSGSVAGTVSNIKYNGSGTTPTNPATYAITADFTPTDAVNYNSITNTSAGNFVISPGSFANADFRTTATGTTTFSDGSNWEYDGGGGTFVPAGVPPSSTNNIEITRNITFDVDFVIGAGKSLTVSAGIANFNSKSITVQSNATGTASIGQITGTITGDNNVTVERYIPANSERAWRLLSIPTNTGQTIHQSWQENEAAGVVGTAHLGTNITSPLSAYLADGFDYQSFSSSMLKYNAGANTWDSVTNTGDNIATTSGYFLYIRGDRSETPSPTPSPTNATTLRTTGALYQGTQPAVSVAGNEFGLIGNIYASTIDFTQLGKTAGIDNKYYVWDPKALNLPPSLGGYVTFSSVTTPAFIPVPAGGGSYAAGVPNTAIQSGQAFFVHASSAGSVTLSEAGKVTGSAMVFRPDSPGSTSGQLSTNLYEQRAGTVSPADGNVAVFNSAYSDAVDGNDALKLSNTQENFGILRNGKVLIIEARQPVTTADTLYFDMWNMKQQQYKLEFVPSNLNDPGLSAVLLDNYLGTRTPVSLGATGSISFTVDGNAGSSASNRFEIVFNNIASPVAVRFTGISAAVQAAGVAVSWKVTNEAGIAHYAVEHSTDGVHFSVIGTAPAKNNNGGGANYSFTDAGASAGANYYRISSTGTDGAVNYTGIVKVMVGASAPSIAVYPNPVSGGHLSIELTNEPAGSYGVRLLNAGGQQLYKTELSHVGGNATQSLDLPAMISQGIYQLEVVTPAKDTHIEKVVIQ